MEGENIERYINISPPPPHQIPYYRTYGGVIAPWVCIWAHDYGQGDMEFKMASMDSVGWDLKEIYLTTLEDKGNEICNGNLVPH